MVLDVLAARQAGGFASPTATFFCMLCNLKIQDIENLISLLGQSGTLVSIFCSQGNGGMHKQAMSRRPSSKTMESDGLLSLIYLTGIQFFLLP